MNKDFSFDYSRIIILLDGDGNHLNPISQKATDENVMLNIINWIPYSRDEWNDES